MARTKGSKNKPKPGLITRVHTKAPAIFKVDLATNWKDAAKICCLLLEAGNEKSKEVARTKIMQMATLADLHTNWAIGKKMLRKGAVKNAKKGGQQ